MAKLKKMVLSLKWSDKRDSEPLENQKPDAAKCVAAKKQVIYSL